MLSNNLLLILKYDRRERLKKGFELCWQIKNQHLKEVLVCSFKILFYLFWRALTQPSSK